MSFFQIRQSTLTGERKTFFSESAIAYAQELKPDQDLGWQLGVEPSRSLIYLHHKLEPVISLDCFEDLVRQTKATPPGAGVSGQKVAKKAE